MSLNFNLQFFGSGGTKTQQVQKRSPQPEQLNTMAQSLYIVKALEKLNK